MPFSDHMHTILITFHIYLFFAGITVAEMRFVCESNGLVELRVLKISHSNTHHIVRQSQNTHRFFVASLSLTVYDSYAQVETKAHLNTTTTTTSNSWEPTKCIGTKGIAERQPIWAWPQKVFSYSPKQQTGITHTHTLRLSTNVDCVEMRIIIDTALIPIDTRAKITAAATAKATSTATTTAKHHKKWNEHDGWNWIHSYIEYFGARNNFVCTFDYNRSFPVCPQTLCVCVCLSTVLLVPFRRFWYAVSVYLAHCHTNTWVHYEIIHIEQNCY